MSAPAGGQDSATLPPEAIADFLREVRGGVEEGLEPLEATRGALDSLPTRLRSAAELVVRRLEGRYHEDEWGFDEDLAEVAFPLFEFLYDYWWRVEASGVINVPAHGRGLLVANGLGALFPYEATMLTTAVMKRHPLPRWPRFLIAGTAGALPFVSGLLRRIGAVTASPRNATRLLGQDHLVIASGADVEEAVRVALATGAPIVPAAVAAPWLGPAGLIPLPSRWRIEICEPLAVAGLGAAAGEDLELVRDLGRRVRETIAARLDDEPGPPLDDPTEG